MSKLDEDVPVVVLLEPATAAERLGVSASGLRRLAPIYEEVHGELPRRGTGAEDKRARLWPEEAIGRLQDARKLVEQERYRTILEALTALRDGRVNTDSLDQFGGRHTGSDYATWQTLQVLLEEMQALRAEVAGLRSEVAGLKALPASAQPERVEDASGTVVLKDQAEPERVGDGLLVRSARWLERRFRD